MTAHWRWTGDVCFAHGSFCPEVFGVRVEYGERCAHRSMVDFLVLRKAISRSGTPINLAGSYWEYSYDPARRFALARSCAKVVRLLARLS